MKTIPFHGLSKFHRIETADARYFAHLQQYEVNGNMIYVGEVWARGFEDDNSVDTKISTFVKYELASARHAIHQSLRGYEGMAG